MLYLRGVFLSCVLGLIAWQIKVYLSRRGQSTPSKIDVSDKDMDTAFIEKDRQISTQKSGIGSKSDTAAIDAAVIIPAAGSVELNLVLQRIMSNMTAGSPELTEEEKAKNSLQAALEAETKWHACDAAREKLLEDLNGAIENAETKVEAAGKPLEALTDLISSAKTKIKSSMSRKRWGSARNLAKDQLEENKEQMDWWRLKVMQVSKSAKVPGGIVVVDAGSSGSKIFSYGEIGSATTAKVLTECTESKDSQPLLGISAFRYNSDRCEPKSEILLENDTVIAELDPGNVTTASELKTLYAPMVLDAVNDIHVSQGEKKDAANQGEVPILATAGMRLLSQAENNLVWRDICGKKSTRSDYTFAESGRNCGTIPGTEEAYYEWMTNIAAGERRTNTGTFTIGGASAQIVIPLHTDSQIEGWTKLSQTVVEILSSEHKNCKNVKLTDDVNSIPIFSERNGAVDYCHKDFVHMRWRREIKLDILPANHRFLSDSLQAVGLVSFLGLGRVSGGIGVAGGVNAIEIWAANNGCGKGMDWSASGRYAGCKQKLLDALEEDLLWVNVRDFFREHGCPNAEHLRIRAEEVTKDEANETKKEAMIMAIMEQPCAYSYNTPSAIPTMQFIQDDIDDAEPIEKMCRLESLAAKISRTASANSMEAGNMLANAVDFFCNDMPSSKPFGFKESKSCMMVYFVSLYMTAFFTSGMVGAEKVRLFFKPLDWSLGVYQKMLNDARKKSKSAHEEA